MREKELVYQGVDSKALFATFVTKLPWLLCMAVAGAIMGSVLNLFIVLNKTRDICYVSETEYYIQFAKGQYEAKNYYNAFTWNDVLATDWILGRAMELLGSTYERSQVRAMMTAEIYSDVRYLTVFVRGQNPAQVEQIKSALETALGEFGEQRQEFDAIYKIEDLEIVQEKIPFFGWRAALLGAVVTIGIGSFWIAFCFCVGSAFYTKSAIAVRLGIPVCGMTFREKRGGNKRHGFIDKQTQMLRACLRNLEKRYTQVLLMDASNGQEAEHLLHDIRDKKLADSSHFQIYHAKDCIDEQKNEQIIVAVIPFGRPYREKILDEIDFAQQHGSSVVAAVLVQADSRWMQIYYAW